LKTLESALSNINAPFVDVIPLLKSFLLLEILQAMPRKKSAKALLPSCNTAPAYAEEI